MLDWTVGSVQAAALDWAVGSVIDALKANGQWDTTIIWYGNFDIVVLGLGGHCCFGFGGAGAIAPLFTNACC